MAHASRVLPVLVELGIVERRHVPPSALCQVRPDNIASRSVSALLDARRTVLRDLARARVASPRRQ